VDAAPRLVGALPWGLLLGWAEVHLNNARMTLTIQAGRNWGSNELANSAPPLSVIGWVDTRQWRNVSLVHREMQI